MNDMKNQNTQNAPAGLCKGGAGFAFFGEYYALLKQVQAALEMDVDIAENELSKTAQRVSELYDRYKDMESGVDSKFLLSLCVAAANQIDRYLLFIQSEYREKTCEEVER